MFKIFKTIKTILLIIVFMLLAVVASVNFGNDKESKIKLRENYFWQASHNTVSFLLFSAENFSKLKLDSKFSFLKNSEENNNNSDEASFNEINFEDVRDEFEEKLETIKLENKFSKFLSFFQAQFARLNKEAPEAIELINTK